MCSTRKTCVTITLHGAVKGPSVKVFLQTVIVIIVIQLTDIKRQTQEQYAMRLHVAQTRKTFAQHITKVIQPELHRALIL